MKINIFKKVGVMLALVHLLAFFGFIYYLADLAGRDGQGPLLWFYWLIIDFPVSIVVVLLFSLNITSHYVMYFVHGVLGTVWWFYLPITLYKGFTKTRSLFNRTM
jgi:hypothetical protein